MKPWQNMPINPNTGERFTPRRWQAEALPIVQKSLMARDRSVVVACTGAGKSVLISEVCLLAESKAGQKDVIVVSCPTQSLVRQLSETIGARVGAEKVGVFYGQKKQPDRRVIIVCNPSLENLVFSLGLAGKAVKLAIVDECHKSEAERFKQAFATLAPRFQLGFTATPFRSADHESLSLWDTVAYRYVLPDAFRDEVLVRPTPIWWDGEGSTDLLDICVGMIEKHGEGPGVVGAVSIKDAEECAEQLTERGIAATPIHSLMSQKAQAEAIEQLKQGQVRCLVHVAMLVEGVDFPWLRWLCLRTPISSRVKMAQQVGRVLRSHPGKTTAIIMDPHGLIQQWRLVEPEALGEALEEALEKQKRKASTGEGEPLEIRQATAISEAMQWTRLLLLEMQSNGSIPFGSVDPGKWRTAHPSIKQLQSLKKMKYWARFLPDDLRETTNTICKPGFADNLQRGVISDILSLLSGVAARATEELGRDYKERAGKKLEWPEMEIEPLEKEQIKTIKKWRTE